MMQRPPAIFAVARNYGKHAEEMKGPPPDRPIVFMKNPSSVIGNGEPIVIPRICDEPGEQVDWEGELAAILGADCRDVREEEALGRVSHYAIANDITARWWKREGAGGQYVRGKSFDTFCPMSEPVAAAEVGDPQKLVLETRLNGEVMQRGSTGQMLFPVSRLIAELSRGMTLPAGTVLLTGTPAGVGFARTPPRFLRAGDVVEVEIEGLGVLRNPVEHE